MQSRTLVNLALLATVLLLALFIYTQQSARESHQLLTNLQVNQINSIVIPRDKGDIVIKKQNDSWYMHKPYTLRAHDFRIDRLLDIVRMPVNKTYDTKDLDLTAYGLNPPMANIKFNDTTIKYGKTNPVNNLRYVQVDQSLFLVNEQLYPLISAQPSSFIDLALLAKDERITRIQLPEFSVSLTDNGSWTTSSDMKIDTDSLQQFIENWQSAQAFGVHAYLSRKQLGNIEIHLDNNDVIKLQITDNEPWLILARPELGVEYHFDQTFVDKLLKLNTQKNNNA